MAGVHRPNPARDRRRERRMLLPEEWPWCGMRHKAVRSEKA